MMFYKNLNIKIFYLILNKMYYNSSNHLYFHAVHTGVGAVNIPSHGRHTRFLNQPINNIPIYIYDTPLQDNLNQSNIITIYIRLC